MAALSRLLNPLDRRSLRPRRSAVGSVAVVAFALVLDLIIWGGGTQLRSGAHVDRAVVVGSAIAIFAVLLLRRRHPLSVFIAALGYSLAWAWLLPSYEPFTAVLIALHHVARHLRLGPALSCLGATGLLWAMNTFNAAVHLNRGPLGVVVTLLLWFVIAGAAWNVGRFGFGTANREAKRAADSARAIENERLRLARELHDIVAHSVSAIMFQAAGAQHAVPDLDARVRTTLEAIESTAVQASRELRRLLGLLNDSVGDDEIDTLDPTVTLGEIPAVLATTRACGVTVDLEQDGTPCALDRSVEHAAFRVIQESLANVMKHGGTGASAQVNLSWRPPGLVITVRSQAGLAPNALRSAGPSGYGLRGLAGRVQGVGGQIEAGPVGQDFLVVVELPMAATVVPHVEPWRTD